MTSLTEILSEKTADPGTEVSQKRGKRGQVKWACHSTQDTHVPRLAQGDGKGHTQEGVEGVALFQTVGTSQGRPVKARAEMNHHHTK